MLITPDMSFDKTRTTKWPVHPMKTRSAWASAQADLSLLCVHGTGLDP